MYLLLTGATKIKIKKYQFLKNKVSVMFDELIHNELKIDQYIEK